MSFVNWSLMAKVSVLLCALGLGALGSMIYAGQQMYAIDDSYSELLEGESAAAINLAKANRSLTEVGASMYWNAAASTDEDNAAAAKQRETADGAFRKSMQTARQSSAVSAAAFQYIDAPTSVSERLALARLIAAAVSPSSSSL